MNQVAEATSVSGDDPHYAAGHAIDGGMQTRWAAAVNDTLSTLTVTLDKTKSFNKITIFEYCDSHSGNDGFSNYRKNRIQGYQIEIIQKGKWIPIYVSDEPMGDCKVIRFPYNYYTSSIRLKVTRATAPPSIYEFNIIYEQIKKVITQFSCIKVKERLVVTLV